MVERRMRSNIRELLEDGVNPVHFARALRASIKSDEKERAEAAAALAADAVADQQVLNASIVDKAAGRVYPADIVKKYGECCLCMDRTATCGLRQPASVKLQDLCPHFFCRPCIENWINEKPGTRVSSSGIVFNFSCPTCNKPALGFEDYETWPGPIAPLP